MPISYAGINQTSKEYSFPTLLEYVQSIRARLAEPLAMPEYAAANEKALLAQVEEKLKGNPYALRAEVYQNMIEVRRTRFAEEPQNIDYQKNAHLYRVAQFVANRDKRDLSIYLYQSSQLEFQAYAYSYLDKAWIFISRDFVRRLDAFNDEELCFIVGHEVGHAQCLHSTINLLSTEKTGRNAEYSADRYGMITCVGWICRQNPGIPAEEAVRRAKLLCVSSLDKIRYAGINPTQNPEWEKYDQEDLMKRFQGWVDGTLPLAPDSKSHPSHERRALALNQFSNSALLYRCAGLEQEPGQSLLDDNSLRQFMSALRTND